MLHTRSKDRLSYHHEIFKVDLTTVQQSAGDGTSHELELEVRDVGTILRELGKLSSPETAPASEYLQTVQVFVNDIKALALRCPLR